MSLKNSLFSSMFSEAGETERFGPALSPEQSKEIIDARNAERIAKGKVEAEKAAEKRSKLAKKEGDVAKAAKDTFETKRDEKKLKAEVQKAEKLSGPTPKTAEEILAMDTSAGVLLAHDTSMSSYLQPVMDSFTIDASDFESALPLVKDGIIKALNTMAASENPIYKESAGTLLAMPEIAKVSSADPELIFSKATPELYAVLALTLPYLSNIELLYNKDVKKFVSSCYTSYASTFGDKKEFEDISKLSVDQIKEYEHAENPRIKELLNKLKVSLAKTPSVAPLIDNASSVLTPEALNPLVLNKSAITNIATNIYYSIVSAGFKDNAKLLELNPQIAKTVSLPSLLKGGKSILSDPAKDLIYAEKELLGKSPAMSRGLFGKNARRTLDFLYFKRSQKEGRPLDKAASQSILSIASSHFPAVFKNIEDVITSNVEANAVEFKAALTKVIELLEPEAKVQGSLALDINEALKALRNIPNEDYAKLVDAIAEVQLAYDAKISTISPEQKKELIDGAKAQISIVNGLKAKYASDPATITALSWYIDCTNFNDCSRQFQDVIPTLDISKLPTDVAKKVFSYANGKSLLLNTFYSLETDQEKHAFFKAVVSRKKETVSKIIDATLKDTRKFDNPMDAADKASALAIVDAKVKATKDDSEDAIAASIVKKEVHDSMQTSMKTTSAIYGIDRARRDAKQAIAGLSKLESSIRTSLSSIVANITSLDTEDKKAVFSEMDPEKASAILEPIVQSAIQSMEGLGFLADVSLDKVKSSVVDTLTQFATKGYLVTPPMLRVVTTSDAVVKSLLVRDLIDYTAASDLVKKLKEPKEVNGKAVTTELVVKPISEGSLFSILSGELAIENTRPEILLATQARCYEYIGKGIEQALASDFTSNLPVELKEYLKASTTIIENLKKSMAIAAKDLKAQAMNCKALLAETYGGMRIPLRMGTTGELEPYLREVVIPTSQGKQMEEVIARICIIFAQIVARKTNTKLAKIYIGFFNSASANDVQTFAEEFTNVLQNINNVIDYEVISNISYIEPKYLEQLNSSAEGKELLSDINEYRTSLLQAPFAVNAKAFLDSNASAGVKNVLSLLNIGKHLLEDSLMRYSEFGAGKKGEGFIRSADEKSMALKELGILYGGIFKASNAVTEYEEKEAGIEPGTAKVSKFVVKDIYSAFENVKALSDKILGITKRGKGRDSGEAQRYAKVKGFDEVIGKVVENISSLEAHQASVMRALTGSDFLNQDQTLERIKANLEAIRSAIIKVQEFTTTNPNTVASHKQILSDFAKVQTPNMEQPSPMVQAIFKVLKKDSKSFEVDATGFNTILTPGVFSGKATLDDIASSYLNAILATENAEQPVKQTAQVEQQPGEELSKEELAANKQAETAEAARLKARAKLDLVGEGLVNMLKKDKSVMEPIAAGNNQAAIDAIKNAIKVGISRNMGILYVGFVENPSLASSLAQVAKLLGSTEKLELITPEGSLIFNLFKLEDQTPISDTIKEHMRQ